MCWKALGGDGRGLLSLAEVAAPFRGMKRVGTVWKALLVLERLF